MELRYSLRSKIGESRLGSVMVIVLNIGHNVRGFKPERGDGFLRAIKVRSTP
jgi:hypothetical protein